MIRRNPQNPAASRPLTPQVIERAIVVKRVEAPKKSVKEDEKND